MIEYRLILEKGSRKFICPRCGRKKFVRYFDTVTNEYLPSQYGRCDRESKCAYHLNPYQDGYAKISQSGTMPSSCVVKDRYDNSNIIANAKQRMTKGVISYEILRALLKEYDKNVFIQNLLLKVPYPFYTIDVEKLVSLYYLGTITQGYREGAIALPFIDFDNKIRAIQVKQFDENNHTTGTDFFHAMLRKYYIENSLSQPDWLKAYLDADKKVSCLFGEHLLNKFPSNPIALVEAPKTALIGTLYFGFPDNPNNMLWLAVYNKSSLSRDKVIVLKGRKVIVFPDLSTNGDTFKEWELKIKNIEDEMKDTKFIFSGLLENCATMEDKLKGLDLADYLIKHDWRMFRSGVCQETTSDMELAEFDKINRRTAIAI